MTQFHTSLKAANDEIARLKKDIAALQARGTELVLERQKLTAFGGRPRRQRIVFGWVERVFGTAIARSAEERAARVVEEAIELAQACGVDKLKVIRLVDRVYSREVGKVEQEIGGVCITLLALSETLGVDSHACETDELERILSLPEQVFRSKQSDKHAAGLGMAVMVP